MIPRQAAAWIDAMQLHSRTAKGDEPLIIDVCGPGEFNGEFGHLKDAGYIARAELSQPLGELDRFKLHEVVLVCRTQMRSAKAASMLKEAGFDNVAALRGGMVEWARRRLPIEAHAMAAVQKKAHS